MGGPSGWSEAGGLGSGGQTHVGGRAEHRGCGLASWRVPNQGLGGPASSHCKPPFSVRGLGGSVTAPPGRGGRGASGRRAQRASLCLLFCTLQTLTSPSFHGDRHPSERRAWRDPQKGLGEMNSSGQAEGNTQEGGSAAWFCCRLAESVSGAPRLVRVCPLLVPRRWRGGDAMRPSPADTLALQHTA